MPKVLRVYLKKQLLPPPQLQHCCHLHDIGNRLWPSFGIYK